MHSKAGKATPGVGNFWSGCAGRAKWGLEMVGYCLDLDNHTAFHLEAIHTKVDKNTDDNLTKFYCKTLKERTKEFKTLSAHLVADAWFAKRPFVQGVLAEGMHIVSRLRDDANLRYLYKPSPMPLQKDLKAVLLNMVEKFSTKTLT